MSLRIVVCEEIPYDLIKGNSKSMRDSLLTIDS